MYYVGDYSKIILESGWVIKEATSLTHEVNEIAFCGYFKDYPHENLLIPEIIEGRKFKSRYIPPRVGSMSSLPPHFTFQEVQLLLQDMMLACLHIHKHGFTHHDIHLGNILHENGKYILIDFGCSKKDDDQIGDIHALQGCINMLIHDDLVDDADIVLAETDALVEEYEEYLDTRQSR